MLPALTLPQHPLRVELHDRKLMIFCQVRKKMVVLTPEEWVRQHVVAYLYHDLHYPLALMKMERLVKGSTRKQRADISIHDRNGNALMLIEFKAPYEPLNKETFFQTGRYNSHIKAPYLLISNGIQHYCCSVDASTNSFNFLSAIPLYATLIETLT
jgi:hypothetical protein